MIRTAYRAYVNINDCWTLHKPEVYLFICHVKLVALYSDLNKTTGLCTDWFFPLTM